MMRVYLEGVGMRGGGLDGWEESRAVLRGDRPYNPGPLNLPPLHLLPANERRRMVLTVKLALAVGADAFAMARRDPADTATVFTSSGGDGETIHGILETLAQSQLEVSPTRFHNSVHNAPSGYWSIATKAQAPTTCLCAHDQSFPAGLLDAASQAVIDDRPMGLIAYDVPYPEPLNSKRTIHAGLGIAMIMTPRQTEGSVASLDIGLDRTPAPPDTMADPALEKLRRGNPAARSLPLLAALAREQDATVRLDYFGGSRVAISVSSLHA